MSYLYQAAAYLSAPHIHHAPSSDAQPGANVTGDDSYGPTPVSGMADTEGGFGVSNGGSRGSEHKDTSLTTLNMPLSRRLLSSLRAISRKGQIRLSPSIKRSICKRCETLLIPGSTSTHRVDNPSRGRKKPWADVLVVRCIACGTEKRFPVGAKKQLRRKLRERGEGPAGVTEDDRVEGYILWSERPDVVINDRTEDAATVRSN
ncbi:MAG: hypothetical protein M1840_004540 [Geoglossum simile]|nr:MAG: hypothetical protein M1840_004540 [Geoglossum simile]